MRIAISGAGVAGAALALWLRLLGEDGGAKADVSVDAIRRIIGESASLPRGENDRLGSRWARYALLLRWRAGVASDVADTWLALR